MTNKTKISVFAGAVVFYLHLACIAVFADVKVPNAFTNHMVLQRNMVVPVWGTGASGEQVTVTFNGQTKTAQTASNGKWSVKLDPMKEGGPFIMTIKGKNTLTISDVYMGEVWQVAGQSNMDTRLSYYTNLADSIKTANVPLLRYYTLRQPGQTNTNWLVVSPSTAGDLSATGYFFGKEIQKTLGVAVGLVVTAVGGTTIEEWLDPATLAANSRIADTNKGDMWDSWVAPVVGYGIKGTVWIQGEQNCSATGAPSYGDRFKLLIKGWRTAWGQGDFPFYYGQLSGTSGTPTADAVSYVAEVREGQRLALSLPKTAMSVNFDYATGGWHFPNKPEAGRRLSLIAKALSYDQTSLVYSGPIYTSKVISGNKVKLLFDQIGGGLVAKDGKLSGFAIASATGNWVWGDAVISGDTVIVSSASISNPSRVRYAWADKPAATLFNKAGLPASSFTTESPDLIEVNVIQNHKIGQFTPAVSVTNQFSRYFIDALGRKQPIAYQMIGDKALWDRSTSKSLLIVKTKSNIQNAVKW